MKQKDLALQKSFLQTVEPNNPNYKNYYPLRKLFGDYLNKLHVAFFDDCCPTATQEGVFPIRFNDSGDILEYFNGTTWVTAPVGGASRFGVAGEDEQAGEDRIFDLDANYFELDGDSSAWTFLGFENEYIDLYTETTGGGAGDAVEILFEPGHMNIFLGANSVLEFTGVDTGTATNGTLGLDASNNLVRVVGGGGAAGSFYQELPNSQTINASGLQALTALSIPGIIDDVIYEVTCYLLCQVNASSTGMQFRYTFTGGIGNQRQIYTAQDDLDPASVYTTAHNDALGFTTIQPVGAIDTPATIGHFVAKGYLRVATGFPGTFGVSVNSVSGGTIDFLPGSYLELRKMADA